MRIRRGIAYLLLGVPSRMISRGPLQTQLLAHEAVDLAAVGAALGLAHHEADDRSDRLGLAALELLHGLRIRLERAVDDALELVGPGHAERALLDDPLGVAPLRRQNVQHGLARGVRDRLGSDQL